MSEANTWCDHNYSVSCSLPAGHEGQHLARVPETEGFPDWALTPDEHAAEVVRLLEIPAVAQLLEAAEERGYQRGLDEAATAQRALSRIGDRLQYHGEVCPPGRLRQLLLAAAKDARTAAAPRGNPQASDAVVEYGHGYVQGRADALEERAELAQELEQSKRTERVTWMGEPLPPLTREESEELQALARGGFFSAATKLAQQYRAREQREQKERRCTAYPCILEVGHVEAHEWAVDITDPRCTSRGSVGVCEMYAGHIGEHRHGHVAWTKDGEWTWTNGGIVDAHGMPVEEQPT